MKRYHELRETGEKGTRRRTVGKRLLALELRGVSGCARCGQAARRTDDVTGPSCAEMPLAVKLTPLGARSLTSRAAVGALAGAGAGQWAAQTCGRVVEVLVDELEGAESAGRSRAAVRGASKHTSFEALAMSLNAGGGNLGTSFSLTTYSVMVAVRVL